MHPVWFLSLSFVMVVAGRVGAQSSRATDAKSAQSAAAGSQRRRVFEFLDKDKNGLLTGDEFLGGTVGKAAEAKLDEFKKLDADESGALDFQEFQKLERLKATPGKAGERVQAAG